MINETDFDTTFLLYLDEMPPLDSEMSPIEYNTSLSNSSTINAKNDDSFINGFNLHYSLKLVKV